VVGLSSSQVLQGRLAIVPYSFVMEAGSRHTIEVKIQDESGNEIRAKTPIDVTLKASSPRGHFLSAGATIGQVRIVTGESSISLEYEDSAAGSWNLTGTTENFFPALAFVTVSPLSLDRFEFEPFTSTPAVGTPFAITIGAKDRFGNIVSDFSKSISLSDMTGTLWPDRTDRFTEGKWTGRVLVLKSGLTKITAQGDGKNGTTPLFMVLAAPAAKIECNFGAAGDTGPVGTALDLSARVTDERGNPVANAEVSWQVVSAPLGATGHKIVTGENSTTRTNRNGSTTNVLILGNKTGRYTVAIKELSSFQMCTLSATAKPTGDFVISVSQYDPYIEEKRTRSVTLTVTKRGDFNDYVNLSISGSPLGVFAALTKVKEVPDFESTLIITLGADARIGTFQITVSGRTSSTASSVAIGFQVVHASPPCWFIPSWFGLVGALTFSWNRYCRRRPFHTQI